MSLYVLQVECINFYVIVSCVHPTPVCIDSTWYALLSASKDMLLLCEHTAAIRCLQLLLLNGTPSYTLQLPQHSLYTTLKLEHLLVLTW
jgi:hypothetical protein